MVDLSRPSLLLINRVAVDKLAHSEFAKNWIASGSSTNDFSEPPGHFLSPDFRLFSEKPTFLTATRLITSNRLQQRWANSR